MCAQADKYGLVVGDYVSSGAPLRLPVTQPWPEFLEWHEGAWKRTAAEGFNVFKLMELADENGFESPFWLTLNAGEAAGGTLKEGAMGVNVVAWRWSEGNETWHGDISAENAGDVTPPAATEFESENPVIAMRPRVVFHLSQWENLAAAPAFGHRELGSREEIIDIAEKIAKTGSGCEIKTGGLQPFYNPSLNYISMPPKENYKTLREYYWALFEQVGHALAGRQQENLFKAGAEAEMAKTPQFRVLYAKMTAAMLAYEAGIDVL